MSRKHVVSALFFALALALGWDGLLSAGRRAVADSPSPTVVQATAPALGVTTTTVIPPAAEATPTAAREKSVPIIQSSVVPVVTETTLTASTSEPLRFLTATTVVATPSLTPITGSALSPVPYIPPLTPAELRANARLRWGAGIPGSVRRWAFLIVPAARRYGLDPNMLAAVMTLESNGDPSAQSWADARGLMQILDGPWDPAANVDEGARLLARFYAQFHSWKLALAAYNAGPNAVVEYGGVPPYRETRDYVIVVRYLYDLYGHKPLTGRRKAQFGATLRDLNALGQQRRRNTRLALAGHLLDSIALLCSRYAEGCGSAQAQPLFPTLDPFWPMGGLPDPLQRIELPAHSLPSP
jgi:Transglycosylase SLT domain